MVFGERSHSLENDSKYSYIELLSPGERKLKKELGYISITVVNMGFF